MSFWCNSFARRLAMAVGICLCAGETLAVIAGRKIDKEWEDPGENKRYLIDGNYYGTNPYWKVQLAAGTAGSALGDTLGDPMVFEYKTVVTVDGKEVLVLPGGTYSSTMATPMYTAQIPLKELGLLEPGACGRHYLKAYTRNFENGVDINYSLLYVDAWVTISYESECEPEKYSVDIQVKDDMTHPDGVMLKVTGKLPQGTVAQIERDGGHLTSVNGQGLLFDRIDFSDACRTFGYRIVVQTDCGTELTASCNGSPGLARVGRMSITNENYEALVVKYPQKDNLTVEFTDAEKLADYQPLVHTLVDGHASRPRTGKLDEQNLEAVMETTKVLFTIDNMLFEEGSHGDYTFNDNQSYYLDKDIVWLKHVIPFGPEYRPAESRVLFMRDDYVGYPGVGMCSNGDLPINWFLYWNIDGTVDLLKTGENIRLGCRHLTSGSLGHSGFHSDEGNIHWVCLAGELSSERTPAFVLPGTSVVVGAGLANDENVACPSNSCHQIAATITHELLHRMVRKRWFEDAGLRFAIDGTGDKEEKVFGRLFGLIGNDFDRIVNEVDHDYRGPFNSDHLSDESERDPFRIEWTCNLDEAIEDPVRQRCEVARESIAQLRFDRTKSDTYGIANVPQREGWSADWSSYATYGDDEVCARLAERFYDRGKVHNDRDWSVKHPELLFIGSCPVPDKAARAAKTVPDLGDAQAQEPGSRSFACSHGPDYEMPPEMSLLSISSAAGDGVAAAGSPHYSALRFDVALSCRTNDWRTLTNSAFTACGYLADDTGRIVAGTTADAAFTDSGEVSVAFEFDGRILYNARGSGYTLAAVSVSLGGIADIDMPVACVTNVAGCVRTFSYAEFARPDVVVDETSFTEGRDATNLLIGVSAEVNTPGTYALKGVIVASNHAVVASAARTVELAEGTNVLALAFSGRRIAELGVDGPYTLRFVKLSRPDGSVAAILFNPYVTTNAYTAAELKPAGDGTAVDYVSGSAAWLEPLVENGAVRALRYGFEIDNPTSSNVSYSVQSVLETEEGAVVGSYATNVTVAAGTIAVVLDYPFAGSEAIRPGGRFRVRFVTLVPIAGDFGTIRLPPSVLSPGDEQGPGLEPPPFMDAVSFDAAAVTVAEGGKAVISVTGGSTNAATSVKVYLTYGTAAAADLNLGKTKYPITLKWAKGEVGEKTFSVPTKNDTAYEDDETFALQLAAPSGLELGATRTCIVTITDDDAGVSLNEGIMNGSVKVSTSGAGKWTAKRRWERWEDEDDSGLFHVESPALKKGKSSTLQLGGMSGPGAIEVVFRFTGATNEAVSSTLRIYAGKKLMHTYRHVDLGNTWNRYTINDYGYGSHTYKYVFTQGSDPDCHVELSEVFWNPSWRYTPCYVSAYSSDSRAGKVTGSGWYKPGAKAKLVAKANPGWSFAGWYTFVEGESGPEYVLWNKNASVTYAVGDDLDVWAEFDRKPYVRGLADTAAGGKVTGSAYLAPGGKVALKATPAANYRFGGWYASDASGERSPDALVGESPSLVVTNAAGDVTYWAAFILNAKVSTAYNAKRGTVSGSGRYAPGASATLTAKPKKGYAFTGWYDADGNLITTAATYRYRAGEDDYALSAQFKKEGELAKPALSWGGETNLTVGVSYTATPKAAGEAAVSVAKVTGLPKGLAFKNGKVSGVPTVRKSYTATVTVALNSNAKKTWTYKVKLDVAALPAWAVGTYYGGNTNCSATVTISGAGKASGKVLFAGNTWTIAGASLVESYRAAEMSVVYRIKATRTDSKKKKATIYLCVGALDDGRGYVEAEDGSFSAEQGVWKSSDAWKAAAAAMAGTTYAVEDEALGTITVMVGANGVATVSNAGRSASATLCPFACNVRTLPVDPSTGAGGETIVGVEARVYAYLPERVKNGKTVARAAFRCLEIAWGDSAVSE